MKSCTDAQIREALALYKNSSLSSAEIAERFDVCPGTLTSWAKEYRLKLRGRGRRRYDEPTVRQRNVLRSVEHIGCKRTGETMGVSKQAVYNIIKRWRDWNPPKGPFPGDVILFQARKMVVIATKGEGGWAWDYKDRKRYRILTWVVGGRAPKKLGVDAGIYPPLNGSAAAKKRVKK